TLVKPVTGSDTVVFAVVYWPQYDEHGPEFRKPGDGDASGSDAMSGWISAALWSMPNTPATVAPSVDGTVRLLAGARSVFPLMLYSFSCTPKAASACAAVPSAAT